MAWGLSGVGGDGTARSHRSGEARRNATMGDQSSYSGKFTLSQAIISFFVARRCHSISGEELILSGPTSAIVLPT